MISIIVALAENGVIGSGNRLPWHLPDDLKRFKALSLGKPIVMGRTTFEHIGRPLDKRVNIVLTRRPDFTAAGVLVAHSIEEALALAGDVPEVVIVGGGEVYRAALPWVNRLYLTFVDGTFRGTAHFPGEIPTPAGFAWRVTHREEFSANEANPIAHTFVVVELVPAGVVEGPRRVLQWAGGDHEPTASNS
jgi:dihydrofolate reductase